MSKLLVTYFSQTGNTQQMAGYVAEGANTAGGDVTLLAVDQVSVDQLLGYQGVIIGSPTYYGSMAAPVKQLLDQSVKHHSQLTGMVGGAFCSAGNIGGGNETTIMDILHALLIHGMVIQGTADGDHYGPVSIGKPDDRVKRQCQALGARMAKLVQKLHG